MFVPNLVHYGFYIIKKKREINTMAVVVPYLVQLLCYIITGKNFMRCFMKEFDKIIGNGDIKAEFEKLCDIMVNNEIYKNLGVTSPHGLLLHGDPSLGKTFITRDIAEIITTCRLTIAID